MMKLNELFKSTSYDDSLFDSKAIAAIESAVFTISQPTGIMKT